MNIPAVFVYGGTIKPGHHGGHDLTVVSVFEAVGQHAAGKMAREEFEAVERKACPGAGSLWRHVHREHDVLRVRGDGDEPARVVHDGGGGRGKG
jgi:hypothetical protein